MFIQNLHINVYNSVVYDCQAIDAISNEWMNKQAGTFIQWKFNDKRNVLWSHENTQAMSEF